MLPSISSRLATAPFVLAAAALADLLVSTPTLLAQAVPPPVLFFSDLTSGPNSGNSDTSLGQTANQHGAVVTVWGNYLGAFQGASTIVVNGAQSPYIYYWGNAVQPYDTANLYASHGMQVVIFQVPNTAASGAGAIQVNVGGVPSGTLPFTVRAGRIFFIARNGNNANAGEVTSPWHDQTILTGSGRLQPGDIAYMRAGVYTEVDEPASYPHMLIVRPTETGTAGFPMALTAYPGETPTLGSATTSKVLAPGGNHWTFAKLRMRGTQKASEYGGGTGKRWVGLEVGDFTQDIYGPFDFEKCNACQVMGNHIYNGGVPGQKLAHLVYYEGNGANYSIEIAWNHLHDALGGRCIQVYGHVAGESLTGLSIHDNVMFNCRLEGILVGASDSGNPSWVTGNVPIYNNVIYSSGLGSFYQGEGSGIRLSSTGADFKVYNNTLVGNKISLWMEGAQTADIRNNIFAKPTQAQTSAVGGPIGSYTFSNNLYVGGTPPTQDPSPITTADAMFVDEVNRNFRLRSSSPAVDSGTALVSTLVTRDSDGRARPQGLGYDIGAFEYGLQVTRVTPNSGSTAGGTSITISGTAFVAGAPLAVSLGGVPATGATFVDSTTVTAVTGAHATGVVGLMFTNGDGVVTALSSAYFYTPPPVADAFFPVTPCRILDTRNANGPFGGPALTPGQARTFTGEGVCGVPVGVTAISANVTVVFPTQTGGLSIYPGNAMFLGTSATSFRAGSVRANNAIIGLATDGAGTMVVLNQSSGTVDVILDVNGYFD